MKLSDYISIDTVYTRSINVERDAESSEIVKSYVPTSRAVNTLYRISETFFQKRAPRSWALIGPYGSGKSSFAVFLSHLFDDPKKEATQCAYEILSNSDEGAEKSIRVHIGDTKGYLNVLITGSPEPLGKRFVLAMRDAALKYWTRAGRKPNIISKLETAVNTKTLTTSEIIELVRELASAVKKTGRGILIVFDEFGKFLEYEARHYESNEIYLLQSLSELALVGDYGNLFIFTLMHQGFDEYARGLGKTLRNEWSKIHGRFETIPFLESTEQVIHILSNAFRNSLSQDAKTDIYDNCFEIAEVLEREGALPGALNVQGAADLFAKCYPLHPITAIILPVLCQKMAQNERTLFSYLGSKEGFGFKERLGKLNSIENWVMPWEIYEYFIQNQPAVLSDPITSRRWAEVVTAVDRLGDAAREDIALLKTIGLFNIIGVQAGFKASEALVKLSAPNKFLLDDSIQSLVSRSVVQFRKFSNEYRVWQGSDFDLDSAVQDELGQIGRFGLAEIVEKLKPLSPIVAHRHSIKKAALRYFIPYFVDQKSYEKLGSKGAEQRLIFYLADSSEDVDFATNTVTEYFSEFDVLAICPNGEQLRQIVGEVLALQRVERNCPELNTDPIAQKEFKDRYALAESVQNTILSDLIESPASIQWFHNSVLLEVENKRNLQQELSRILDDIYALSPIIRNELINREKPSAQAAAARNKLVFAMLAHMDKKELGIEKFPAEKGIYKAFLYATGLHRKGADGSWGLFAPNSDNEFNLYPVWEKMEDFLKTTSEQPRSFSELDRALISPPYGVKAGVLPIFYLTSFLCNQSKLAFYENGVYTPYITEQHMERFMKRPDHFTVQQLEIRGLRASLFDSYAKVLYGDNSEQDITLLKIARPLAKFIDDLEGYTQQTNRISDAAQNAIKAVKLSNSPADMLFVRLPKACGFPDINPDETNTEKIEGFSDSLIKVIRELRDAYKHMLEEFINVFQSALLPDNTSSLTLSQVREKVRGRFDELDRYTIDTKVLKPFIEHLTDKRGEDTLWFKRMLLFLGAKAPEKWSDVERDNAVLKLTQLSKRLIDLRILQDHHVKNKLNLKGDFDLIRLHSMRYGKSDHEEIIQIDGPTRAYLNEQKSRLNDAMANMEEQNKINLLADILDDLLTKKERQSRLGDDRVSNE